MWALIVRLLPSHVYLFTSAALFDEAAPDRPYVYAYARLVPRLTYGLYRIKWLGGVCLSTLADVAFATEGPVRGVIETIVWLTLWLTRRLKPV